jgi:hypothetical protein
MSSGVAEYTAATPTRLQLLVRRRNLHLVSPLYVVPKSTPTISRSCGALGALEALEALIPVAMLALVPGLNA